MLKVYTDGATSGNPGPGGWGFVIYEEDGHEACSGQGGFKKTTNNRMELMAVLEAMVCLFNYDETDRDITIHSDSAYVVNALTKGWLQGWRRRDWQTSTGTDVKNVDLWIQIYELLRYFPKLRFQWVRGHNGNKGNERADELAVAAKSGDLAVDHGYAQ